MFARRAVKAVAVATVALFCVAGSLDIADAAYAGTGVGASDNTITNAAQAQSPFTAGTFDSGQPIDVVIPANTILTPEPTSSSSSVPPPAGSTRSARPPVTGIPAIRAGPSPSSRTVRSM